MSYRNNEPTNDPLLYNKNNIQCLFTKDDWDIWEEIQNRHKPKESIIKKEIPYDKCIFNKSGLHYLTRIYKANFELSYPVGKPTYFFMCKHCKKFGYTKEAMNGKSKKYLENIKLLGTINPIIHSCKHDVNIVYQPIEHGVISSFYNEESVNYFWHTFRDILYCPILDELVKS